MLSVDTADYVRRICERSITSMHEDFLTLLPRSDIRKYLFTVNRGEIELYGKSS